MSFTKKLKLVFSGLIFLAIGGFSLPSSANLMQIDLGFSTNTSEGFRVINAHLVYDDRAYTIENRSSQIQVTTFNSFSVDLSIGSNQNGVFSYAPYAATLDPASELRWTLYRETDPQGNLVYNRTNLYLKHSNQVTLSDLLVSLETQPRIHQARGLISILTHLDAQ
jgi:hypothetical protein